MKKNLIILLILHTTIFSQEESSNIKNNGQEIIFVTSQEQRANNNNNKIAPINFTTPIVFNPNHTPYPTQPARIANISDLLVYIDGTTENGPFGSVQSTLNQINAINNTNIGATYSSEDSNTSKIKPDQIIATQKIQSNNQPNLTPEQLITAQNHALLVAGIAASSQNGNHFGIIQAQQALSIGAAHASATNNASQAANQIKPNQASAGSPIITQQIISQHSQQDTIANPNPFVTINNPPSEPRIVMWNAPLIIDHKNVFFNTQSVVKFEENIIYNPGKNYNYPDDCTPAAIIIAKDNITIDLAGFNLSFSPRSAAPLLLNKPTYGIAIAQGVKNVKIISSSPIDKPGSISGFSGYAIYGEGNHISHTYSPYENMIRNIIIDNIVMYSNLGGIYLENAVQIAINYISVSYSFGARDIEGIYLKNVLNGLINSSKINQNFSYRTIKGIRLDDTVGIVVNDCTIDNNRSLENGDAIGILLDATSDTSSHYNRISNCNITENLCSYVIDKEAIGISMRNGTYNNAVENCIIFGHTHGPSFGGATPPITDPISYGIKINRSLNNQILKNQVGYNGNFGIYDSTTAPISYSPVTPSTPTSISSSFFTNNTCLFNTTNYWVTVPNLFPAPASPGIALPTTILYPGNLTAYSGGGAILQNLEVRTYN